MAIQYIPCAKNDNKGEQVTRNFLMNTPTNTDGILLGNYHLPVNNGTLECDLILFNQRGIWVIEVKNWRGRIKIDRVNWQRSDKLIQHSPLISVEAKAKNLVTVLANEGFRNISVVSLVVLAQSSAVLENTDDLKSREPREDKIFHLEDRLIRALTGRNYLYKSTNRELSGKHIQRIVHMLLPRTVDPQQERIGDSYRILYDLGPGPDEVFHAYQAEHINIPGRYARAKKYYTPTVYSTGELKVTIPRFRRDMQALVKMEHHPNIVQVYDYQPDRDSSDIYWLLLEWIKGITLQDRLDNGPEILFQEQLRTLYPILDALDCCHSNNILHRNLTPSCIYLANDGTVKLSDFDFARVPADLAVTLTDVGRPLPVKANRYTAPELQTDARAADARSDLYALGAIWYDMIVRLEPHEEIDLARLEGKEISLDARDLLTRLLNPDPDERPKSAKAMKKWLEQI
jgi:eukaryotic-like serine/threonine-protein kinase